MLTLTAAMAMLALAANPPAPPPSTQAAVADVDCLKAAVRQLDDHVSAPDRIATMAEGQCSATFQGMVDEMASADRYNMRPLSKLRLYERLRPIHHSMAVQFVFRHRQARAP